jgi:hypothetical protein
MTESVQILNARRTPIDKTGISGDTQRSGSS